jgi:hypothetical protein
MRIYRKSEGYFRPALDYIVHECDRWYVIQNIAPGQTDGSFQDEKDEISVINGELVQFLNDALADGRITAHESGQARQKLERLRGVVDRFIAEVEEYEKRPGR